MDRERSHPQNNLQMSYIREPALGCLIQRMDEQLVSAKKGTTTTIGLDQYQLRESPTLFNHPIPYHNIPKDKKPENRKEK